MLNYRHIAHAGNFADVLKHAVVALLLEGLKCNADPFCFHDTHAGAGCYDLFAPQAKTGEAASGIGRLWRSTHIPAAFAGYLQTVRDLNPDGRLRFYPGSPHLARQFMRSEDRLVLTELQPSEEQALHRAFAGDRQVAIHRMDAYAGVRELLPPRESHGLVLIDPPYEVEAEYEQVAEGVRQAYSRWKSGQIALWYPVIQGRGGVRDFLTGCGIGRALLVELRMRPAAVGMSGAGMLLVNPPGDVEATLRQAMPWLFQQLCPGHAGSSCIEWFVPG